MLALRHIVALVLMFVSLIGVLTFSFLDVLDIDRMLVEIAKCDGACIMAVGNRCVRCAEVVPGEHNRHKRASAMFSAEENLHYHPKNLKKDPYRAYASDNTYHHHQNLVHNMVDSEQEDRQIIDSNGCVMLTACLRDCPASDLENICADKVDRSDQDSDITEYIESGAEPLCETGRPAAMGHAGGDPVNACENTVEATLAGLRGGMTAVHLDVSVSSDNVPFLWRDHDPRSLTARLRQMGSYGVAGCRPALAPDTVKPAHLLTWDTIESSWFYVNTTAGLPVDHEVITFKEWLEDVGDQLHLLDRIWIEFRVPKELLRPTILLVWELTKMAGIQEKLFFNINQDSEIMFPNGVTLIGGVEASVDKLSDHQWNALVYFLEEVQTAEKDDDVLILNREDEVVYALMVEKLSAKPSVLSQEVKALVDTSHLDLRGINFEVKALSRLVGNTEQIIISRDKITRDNCNPQYTQVIVWTVNSVSMMKKMVCMHVDYVITDYPGRFAANPECDDTSIEEPIKEDCPPFCTRQYAPVCGSDGKTHSNQCMLKFHSCEQGLNLKMKYDGRCKTDEDEKEEKATSRKEDRANRMSDISPEYEYEVIQRSAASGGNKTREKPGYHKHQELEIDTDLLCTHLFCVAKQGYKPVCGKNGLTYDSDCHLRKSRCHGKAVGKAHNGACHADPCAVTCCNVENPVCGTDRVSYMNQCLLERAACFDREDGTSLNLWHRGHCGQCTFICTREYRPVCGSDGLTYANQCAMERQSCDNQKPVWRVHKGECKRPDLEITYHSTRKENAIDAANIEEDEEEDDDDIVTTNFSLHPAELDAGRVKQHLHELYGHLGHEEYVYGERNHESEKSSGKIDNIYLRAAENPS